MAKKHRIIYSIVAGVLLTVVIYAFFVILDFFITYAIYYPQHLPIDSENIYLPYAIKTGIVLFAIICSTAFIIFSTIYMWRSMKPLTAEQLAERKAIKAERKKARLQEKLNKL